MSIITQSEKVYELYQTVKMATNARGVARQVFMETAREQIKQMDNRQVKSLIKMVENLDRQHLVILLGIGIRNPLRAVVLKQYMRGLGPIE